MENSKLTDLLRKAKISEECRRAARKTFSQSYNQAFFIAHSVSRLVKGVEGHIAIEEFGKKSCFKYLKSFNFSFQKCEL